MSELLGNMVIRTTLDSSGVESGLSGMRQQMRQANQAMRAQMSGFDRSEKSVGKYGTQIEGLGRKIRVQGGIVSDAQRKYDEAVESKGEFSEEARKAETALNREKAALGNMERQMSSLQSELAELQRQQEIANSGWTKMGERLVSAGDKMQSVGRGMQQVGKSMSMYVTAPIVGVGAAAVKVGMDFSAGMSKVSALSGATGKDLNDLEGIAREMGATTQFSATEASEALQYMALAGWDTQQMMDGLPGVLDLAAAGGVDLGKASDMVTKFYWSVVEKSAA